MLGYYLDHPGAQPTNDELAVIVSATSDYLEHVVRQLVIDGILTRKTIFTVKDTSK